MKKYLVFGGDHYYPSGGWYDFIKDCDELYEARALIEIGKYDWTCIIDRDTKEEID